jgi:hypothetical protein
MTAQNENTDARDEVLYAFHLACERPTAAQIIEWTTRYPQFADDIRAHAAIARDWEATRAVPALKPDANMLSRGQSRILNALHNAAVTVPAKAQTEPCQSFQQIMAARGTDVPRLARELNIGRSVLADLFNGGILAPVGRRLVNALANALAIRTASFDAMLTLALNSPRIGHAKADGTPTLIPRPYEEVIRSSNMDAERIRYWLSED